MHLISLAAIAALLSTTALHAASVTLTETMKLTASDGTRGDSFGYSVAISGNLALIGAVGDDDNGNNSGSAYLIDITTGTQTKLTASDGAANDYFGYSVALDGATALIGAAQDDDKGSNSGSAYLFDTTTGTQTKLTASDGTADDYFGWSVALDGSTALIGALFDDDKGPYSGSAYLIDTTTGTQTKLTASDGAEDDSFGIAVALDGSTALIGALFDDDKGSDSGSAYLIDTTTGTETKLIASDGARGDEFGTSVALDGSMALVGSPFNDGTGFNSGAAYLFDLLTGTEIKLLADDGTTSDYFGVSVAISGPLAIVGAVGDDFHTGSAYVFDVTTGEQLAKLTASGGPARDQFGWSVAIDGSTALVGAVDNEGAIGAAYVFDLSSLLASPTTPVPLPAGVWLLGAGLGALGLMRRRG